MAALPPDSPRSRFDELYGLEVSELGDGVARGNVVVRDELKQPAGLVHGGVYAAMAEALASVGTYVAVHEDGNTAMGMSNNTTFLRPVTQGTVHAVARARHRGRTTWVWDVELTDDHDRQIAVSRVTIAVRPQRG
ncbi:MAG: PaaI family thioesterase [Solirubrobacteraceae bacterium]